MKIRKSVLAVVVIAGLLLCIGLAVYWQDFTVVRIGNEGKETENKKSTSAQWEEAAHTPLGKYPETVEYTLGKIAGANNANMPVGDTYEDNAYTRYLREILNIQNVDVFELEAGGSYEEALEMAIADKDIPDVLVVNGRDNLIRLAEDGLIEDLTEVYEECTTDTIKEM